TPGRRREIRPGRMADTAEFRSRGAQRSASRSRVGRVVHRQRCCGRVPGDVLDQRRLIRMWHADDTATGTAADGAPEMCGAAVRPLWTVRNIGQLAVLPAGTRYYDRPVAERWYLMLSRVTVLVAAVALVAGCTATKPA